MDEKKKGSVNEQPQIVLEGKIPGTEESVYFTEEKVDDKGDCGFIALGVSRDNVADALLEVSPIDDKREQLWQEIYEAFETNRLARTPEFEALFNAFQEPNLSHEIYDARLRAIEIYCKSEDVFKMYVEAYRGKLWLGYKSALLFAQEQNMTVYIWRKNNKTKALEVLDSHVEESSAQVIHMLLTQGYSHYNLLVEAKKPVKSADVSSYVQKMPALNFRNDAHYSFIEKVFLLTEQEMSEIFIVPPVEEVKKFKKLERNFQLGRENNVRSNKGRELFEEISALARSVFPELRHPLLNEELKALILNAKQFVEESFLLKGKPSSSPKKDVLPLKENEKSKALVSAASKESKLLAVVPSAGIMYQANLAINPEVPEAQQAVRVGNQVVSTTTNRTVDEFVKYTELNLIGTVSSGILTAAFEGQKIDLESMAAQFLGSEVGKILSDTPMVKDIGKGIQEIARANPWITSMVSGVDNVVDDISKGITKVENAVERFFDPAITSPNAQVPAASVKLKSSQARAMAKHGLHAQPHVLNHAGPNGNYIGTNLGIPDDSTIDDFDPNAYGDNSSATVSGSSVNRVSSESNIIFNLQLLSLR